MMSGHDEASLNPLGRQTSDKDGRDGSFEESYKKSRRNKETRKKRTTTMGSWNVRTLKEIGTFYLLIRELSHQKVNIT
ncbi:hypothetical protein PoB_003488700 [Plakobranchus ocellatus]|uniref:Uncharacterized protein n=1 Tax=Plakobranchus ocellatus TaxID=259542 RepID=A0AAV4AN79_9GAST|nr:hypothetical protein PoB_003488700 [Plakobranchus ocellatus]